MLRELRASGCECEYYHHDVTREEDWQSIVAQTRGTVRQARRSSSTMPGSASPVLWSTWRFADWKRQVAVNLDGVFLGVKHSLPVDAGGRRRKHHQRFLDCRIRGFAERLGLLRDQGRRAAVHRNLSRWNAQPPGTGVRVNSLHPGITETAIWDTLIGTVEDGSNGGRERGPTLDKLTERAVPLGYKAAPEDIANGILWLASDESRYRHRHRNS